MKKIYVNTEGCIGCGACVGLDSKHFDFNEDGYSYVCSQENIDLELIQSVIEACPVEVITLEEIPEKTKDEEQSVISYEELKQYTNKDEHQHEENCNNKCHCKDECHKKDEKAA